MWMPPFPKVILAQCQKCLQMLAKWNWPKPQSCSTSRQMTSTVRAMEKVIQKPKRWPRSGCAPPKCPTSCSFDHQQTERLTEELCAVGCCCIPRRQLDNRNWCSRRQASTMCFLNCSLDSVSASSLASYASGDCCCESEQLNVVHHSLWSFCLKNVVKFSLSRITLWKWSYVVIGILHRSYVKLNVVINRYLKFYRKNILEIINTGIFC